MGKFSNVDQLRPPIKDQLIQLTGDNSGLATDTFQRYLTSLNQTLLNLVGINVQQKGAKGNGITDDSAAFQAAAQQAAAQGGGIVIVPTGRYNLVAFATPSGIAPITFLGSGDSSVLLGFGNAPVGMGRVNVYGSNVTFQNLLIDGQRTVAIGLAYNRDFVGIGNNDPMANSLTQNTSVWVHGAVDSPVFDGVNWKHTAGYGILFDCITGTITNGAVLRCNFTNNYPNTFGVVGGPLVYGAWTGCIYINGDGRAANPGLVMKGLTVQQCRFLRNAGNCLWSHLFGLDELHQDFRFIGNFFEDCGLDGILIGGVSGGVVDGNVFHRVGYVCTDDTGRPVPRWLPNLQATALDSGGLVNGVPYCNNSFESINGGCMDLDSHGLSALTGNVMRTPYPNEPEYIEDQIAFTGPNNNANSSYGMNLGNSNQKPYGAFGIEIAGNTFINLPAGSIRMYAARSVHVTANNIIAPDVSLYPPIGMGPIGPGPNQRCYNNKVTGNNIQYNPPVAIPAIFEDETLSPFLGTEQNTVCNNVPISPPGTLAIEFQKAAHSGSTVYSTQVWFP